MKKSTAGLLCFIGCVAGLFVLQNYDQRRLNQIMSDCQSKIAIAQLDGKSPQEVAAFLDTQNIAHDPYTGAELIHGEGKNISLKEGFIDGYAGSYIYLFKWPGGDFWHVRITFTFDGQNKYKSSFVYAEGRR